MELTIVADCCMQMLPEVVESRSLLDAKLRLSRRHSPVF